MTTAAPPKASLLDARSGPRPHHPTFEQNLAHAVIMRTLGARDRHWFRTDNPDLGFWCAVVGADPAAVARAARARMDRAAGAETFADDGLMVGEGE